MTYKTERYDYEHQAWIGTDGRYLCCAHPEAMQCHCYGKVHAGELASYEIVASMLGTTKKEAQQ